MSTVRRISLNVATAAAILCCAVVLFIGWEYRFGVAGIRRHHLESWVMAAAAFAFVRGMLAGAGIPRYCQAIRISWWMVCGIGVTAVLVFAPALGLPLLSDDHVLLDWATHNQFVGAQEPFVRPIPLLVWRVAGWVPRTPAVLHTMNVLLHGLNGGLVLLLLDAVGLTPAVAMLGAVGFVVWPTQVEAVAWSAGMFDVLMTTFVLMTCLLVVRTSGRIHRRIWAIVALGALGLLTKETAVCLPALIIVLLLDRWQVQRPSRAEMCIIGAMVAVASAYLTWRLVFRRPVEVAPVPVLTRYALKEQLSRSYGGLSVPLTTDFMRVHPVVALTFTVVIFSIIVSAVLLHRRGGPSILPSLVGIAWITIAAFPAMGLLFVGDNLDGSRHLYLPAVGLMLAVCASCNVLIQECWAGGMAAVVIFAALIPACVLQDLALLHDWRRAGDIQSAVLSRAIETARAANCVPARLENCPAVYRGTQVLRNGAIEAFRAVYSQAADHTGKSCALVWSNDRFDVLELRPIP